MADVSIADTAIGDESKPEMVAYAALFEQLKSRFSAEHASCSAENRDFSCSNRAA